MPSWAIIVLAATSTAAAVLVLVLLLSTLVRSLVHPWWRIMSAGGKRRVRRSPGPVLEPAVPKGRSANMPQFRRSRPARPERGAGQDVERGSDGGGSVKEDSATYRQVGEEVTTVLSAAEQAAAQIRETALREAEQIKRAAAEEAAATLAEAEARRAEAERYGGDTRAAADAYADETRRRADDTAAKQLAEAEEQARLIRVESEQKASGLVAEAVRRRETLTKSTADVEDRVGTVLTTLRGVTTELEKLLPAQPRTAVDEPESQAHDQLDEAPKPLRLTPR